MKNNKYHLKEACWSYFENGKDHLRLFSTEKLLTDKRIFFFFADIFVCSLSFTGLVFVFVKMEVWSSPKLSVTKKEEDGGGEIGRVYLTYT